MNLIKDLTYRKLIKQITDKQKIKNLLKNKKNTIYCGFDPTYKSLHIGHLIPIITLKRFLKYGYNIIILIGETTSIIGDPSFRNKTRPIQSPKLAENYADHITKQIKYIFKKELSLHNNIIILNNKKWFENMKITYFLKKIGQHFSVMQILNKEAMKQRNKINQKNLNFSELTYNILQSYDYQYLYKKYNVSLQIGGDDQWGNMISGIKLIHKLYHIQTYAFTLPLMINKKKEKIGKSINQQKNIWLNIKLTSPYKYYQYWINIPDDITHIILKQLTFLNITKIEKIIKDYHICKIKIIIAKLLTYDLHGFNELKKAIFITNIFFNIFKIKISLNILNKLFKQNIPKIKLKKNIKIKNLLILLKIVNSKTQASHLIQNKSITINNKIISDKEYIISNKDTLFKKFIILCKGKKNFFLIKYYF